MPNWVIDHLGGVEGGAEPGCKKNSGVIHELFLRSSEKFDWTDFLKCPSCEKLTTVRTTKATHRIK